MQGDSPPPPDSSQFQYVDYAMWERKLWRRDGAAYANAVSWWTQNLADAPPAFRFSFTRRKKASNVTPADGQVSWSIDRQVSHQLNVLGTSQGCTPATVRLAAFAALLANDVRASDICIGMYVSGRNRLPLQRIFGDFTNLVTLRFKFDATKTFSEWLLLVRNQVLQAEANGRIPYEEVYEELSRVGIRPPDIQAIFHPVFSHRILEFAGLSLRPLDRARQTFPWGFTVNLDDRDEVNGCQMLFDPRIYDPVGVQLFADRYKRLLTVLSQHAGKTLETSLAMSGADRAASAGLMRIFGNFKSLFKIRQILL
jgi:hypothetical protein